MGGDLGPFASKLKWVHEYRFRIRSVHGGIMLQFQSLTMEVEL